MVKKKENKFSLKEIEYMVLSAVGFLISIFVVNMSRANYSFDLDNAVEVFSSSLQILINIGKGFSIFISFFLLLVLSLFLVYWGSVFFEKKK